jgi:hypothetical protein
MFYKKSEMKSHKGQATLCRLKNGKGVKVITFFSEATRMSLVPRFT